MLRVVPSPVDRAEGKTSIVAKPVEAGIIRSDFIGEPEMRRLVLTIFSAGLLALASIVPVSAAHPVCVSNEAHADFIGNANGEALLHAGFGGLSTANSHIRSC